MTQDEKIQLGETLFDLMREPGGQFWRELSYSEQTRWIMAAYAIFQLGVESVPC